MIIHDKYKNMEENIRDSNFFKKKIIIFKNIQLEAIIAFKEKELSH